jgi:hypothetical protein
MPHAGIRSVAGADLRRGRQPGKADPIHPARKQVLFRGREEGIPVCLGTAVANPIIVGRARGTRGGRWFRSLPAFPHDEGNRSKGSPTGWTLCLATAENPSRDVSAGMWRDGRAGRHCQVDGAGCSVAWCGWVTLGSWRPCRRCCSRVTGIRWRSSVTVCGCTTGSAQSPRGRGDDDGPRCPGHL